MSKNYISPSMIPMKEIAQYLSKVEGFGKKTENAVDTNNVAAIKAALIAKAATNEQGELLVDRETVVNCLKLGGIPANKYLTTDSASSLLVDTYKVSINNSNEIKNLRNELYQIKSSLVKNGMVNDIPSYSGFIDPFVNNNKKYLWDTITVTNTDNSNPQITAISVEDASEFIAGEYIVVSTTQPQIVQIYDIVGNRLDLSSSIAGPIAINTPIRKSYGSYNKGSFVFGEIAEHIVDSKEKYIILNDDAHTLVLPQKHNNSGFAAHINIPSTANGKLNRVGIKTRVVGNPGSLKCYVVKTNNNTPEIELTHSIDDLIENGFVVGQSKFLHSSQATQSFNELYFDFEETVVLSDNNYMFLFVQMNSDEYNYWDFKGLRGKDSLDLQTNSSLYSFVEGLGFTKEEGDLYLVVVTSEILLNQLQHQKQGLYSCNVDLNNSLASRVRVELKINREGRFRVIDEPTTLVPNGERALITYNEDNKSYSGSLFSTDDIIAINNNLAQVGANRTSNTSFTLKEDTYAPAGSKVYRIGYKVQAKAFNKSIDLTNANAPEIITDTILKNLTPVAIIPSNDNNNSSDRIIFECDLEQETLESIKLKEFNSLEIQVFWNNNLTVMEINNMPELAGAIKEIVITTDNAYNTISNISKS